MPPRGLNYDETGLQALDEAGLQAQQAAQQEEQLNALRVLYGAKAAVAEEVGGVAAKFAEAMKNITFPSEESKQSSINTAFVSACSEGTVPEVSAISTLY